MRLYVLVGVMALLATGCGPSVNVEQERNALLALDREWSASAKDIDQYMSYLAPEATVYAPGMRLTSGVGPIRDMFTKMASMPGFSVEWTPTKAEVSAGGDIGYTAGTYKTMMAGSTELGKYVTVWTKQSGEWKVSEDIFNADEDPRAAPEQHVMMAPGALTWTEAPPSLPPGSRMAVISGDPSQPQPYVFRAQVPAGYLVPPHWHPTAEHLTVLSGTVSLGMGETYNASTMTDLPPGGYVALPAEMRHSFLSKTAATFQVHGMGPFAITYVNAADDPRQQTK